jgi:ankyrin repeat protein
VVSSGASSHMARRNGPSSSTPAWLLPVETDTPLNSVADDGDVEAVRRLVETADGATPLYLAARDGHTEAMRPLIEPGAGVEAQGAHGARPLHMGAHSGCAGTMGALLELGADVPAGGGRTALHTASSAARG